MTTQTAQSTAAPSRETITHEEFLRQLAAQGVAKSGDYAFRCVCCGTVQSMRSWVAAGESPDTVERVIGFSCIGRRTRAGAWDAKKKGRRDVPGCDWTIGGLFGDLGRGIVVTHEGGERGCFPLATPEEAQELARRGGAPFRPE